ncbi:MAG: hypothetical protein NC117_05520 [Pseudoflavonifractor sp.]|nr:hypothetical protein [Pseudoflavonifractor sp.]
MTDLITCPVCGGPLLPAQTLCYNCGTRLPNDAPAANSFATTSSATDANKMSDATAPTIIHHKALWKIPANVVAQSISPADFDNLDNVSGIIVQNGVTALIYINGQEMAQVNGGTYDFVSTAEIDRLMRQSSLIPASKPKVSMWRALWRLIRRKKVDTGNTASGSSIKNVDDAIRHLRRDSIINAYLKTDTPFQVIVSGDQGIHGYEPLEIRCRHLIAPIGMTVQLEISDFNQFIRHFLVSSQTVTCEEIAREIRPTVKSILESCLRNVDIIEYGLPIQARMEIDRQLSQAISIPGLRFVKTIEVTCSSKDLERLATVADELYLSEKELDFARRTNEFRNRLAAVENAQKIDDARNDLALHKALQEVNRDLLLSEDEVDEFYMLLSRQKKIRESNNDMEIERALNDIERGRLTNRDEMEALRTELASRRDKRESVATIMQMQNLADTEAKRIEIDRLLLAREHDVEIEKEKYRQELEDLNRTHGYAKALEDAEIATQVTERDIATQRLRDNYSDTRHVAEVRKRKDEIDLDIYTQTRIDQLDAERENRKHARGMEFIRQCQAHETELKRQRLDLEDRKTDQLKVMSGMSSDQILATGVRDLTPEAQIELAKGIGNRGTSEEVLRLHEEKQRLIQEQADKNRDMMEGITDKMFELTRQALGGKQEADLRRYDDQARLTDEYRRRMEHEQDRYDRTNQGMMAHETDLHNSAVDAIRAASGQPHPADSLRGVKVICPQCRQIVDMDKFCKLCGAELNIRR